jgi:hypothetical protein
LRPDAAGPPKAQDDEPHLNIPQPDRSILSRRAEIVGALAQLVPGGIVSEAAGLAAFDGDALSAYRQTPLVCVLPKTKDEVSAVLRFTVAVRCFMQTILKRG